jgi:hypothetical protein
MIKKIRNNSLFGIQGGIGLFGNSIKKKDLNWRQAKARYPKLSPFGDADRDGVKNFRDCHPFDRKRQDDATSEEEAEYNAYHRGAERPSWDERRDEESKRRAQMKANEEIYNQQMAALNIARIAKQRRAQGKSLNFNR